MMSRKTKLAHSMMRTISQMGGSHLTREPRERTTTRFARVMRVHGYSHLVDVRQIRGRHIRVYVAHLGDLGLAVRTCQNAMADLRQILRAAGCGRLADAPELANRALGIGGGSRIGQKTALLPEEYESFRVRAQRLRRPGMAALIGLERHLGLRAKEAICARQDTLGRWLRELDDRGAVIVIDGTKGGRPRFVWVHTEYQDDVRTAVGAAWAVAKRQGGYLVAPRGKRKVGSLKQACTIYGSYCHRAGVQLHAARYAWAQDQYQAYRRRGFSTREALLRVSLDLGHGTGRGRWAKSVYLRGLRDRDRDC